MMHGGSTLVTHGGSMLMTHLSAAQLGMIWKHVTENPPGIVSGSM